MSARPQPAYFIVMQVDRARWHGAKDLHVPERIRLIFQPASRPEVNPVEHLWEEMREKYLHNRIFPSLEDLIEVLCQALSQLDFGQTTAAFHDVLPPFQSGE